jgi:hypothetical protein
MNGFCFSICVSISLSAVSHLEAFPEPAGDTALAAGGDHTVSASAPTPEAGDRTLGRPPEEGAARVTALT